MLYIYWLLSSLKMIGVICKCHDWRQVCATKQIRLYLVATFDCQITWTCFSELPSLYFHYHLPRILIYFTETNEETSVEKLCHLWFIVICFWNLFWLCMWLDLCGVYFTQCPIFPSVFNFYCCRSFGKTMLILIIWPMRYCSVKFVMVNQTFLHFFHEHWSTNSVHSYLFILLICQ